MEERSWVLVLLGVVMVDDCGVARGTYPSAGLLHTLLFVFYFYTNITKSSIAIFVFQNCEKGGRDGKCCAL